MDPLAAEIKFISDLAEGSSGGPHLQNIFISIFIGSWAGPKRAPLPSWNFLELLDPVLRKLIFLFSLPHVTNPCSQKNFFSFENFNMYRGNQAMALPQRKLSEGFFVEFESCIVVHSRDNNSTFSSS